MTDRRRAALAALALLLAAGCAAKFVPSQRMTRLRATMDPAEAANLFADSLNRSPRGPGLCKAPFGFDDPKATATMDGFTIQAWRAGEEVGRREEGGRTIVSYKKVRYAEERRFADLGKIRVTRDARGMCAGPVPAGNSAITLHGGPGLVPLVLAVESSQLDDVLAALTVLAPKASLVEGAGL